MEKEKTINHDSYKELIVLHMAGRAVRFLENEVADSEPFFELTNKEQGSVDLNYGEYFIKHFERQFQAPMTAEQKQNIKKLSNEMWFFITSRIDKEGL